MTTYLQNNWFKIISVCVLSILAIVLAYASAYIDFPLIIIGFAGIVLLGIILKQPLWGVFLLTFFLPFERIGSVDIAGMTVRISQVLALFTLLGWFIKSLVHKDFNLPRHPLAIPLVLFIMVNLFGLLNSPNLKRSVLVLGFTIFTIAVTFLVPTLLRTKAQVTWLIKLLLLSMTLVSMFGIYQFIGDLAGLPTSLTGLREQYTKGILGFPRIQSTALEPLYFANYLLIPLGVALALFFSKQHPFRSWHLLFAIGLGGLNLVLTVSRGGYIAFAAMLGLLSLVFFKQVFTVRNIFTLGVVSGIIFLLALRFLNVANQIDNFTHHVTNIFGGASYVERVETFEIAQDIWQQHPIIGIGPGGFGPYASYHPLITPGDGYQIVNNEYIELLAETGIVGLSLYVVMVIMVILRSWKAYKKGADPFLKSILIGLTAAFIGILAQYNTFSILYIMHIWFLIGLIIAIQNLLLPSHEKHLS